MFGSVVIEDSTRPDGVPIGTMNAHKFSLEAVGPNKASRKRRCPYCLLAIPFVFPIFTTTSALSAEAAYGQDLPDSLSAIRDTVAAASARGRPWEGPRHGPAGAFGKTIVIVTEDLRNGGILGVARGVDEAAKELNWRVKVFDAEGTPAGRDKAAALALAARPDGLIIIGADADDMRSRLMPFADQRIPVVGWHVGPQPGVLEQGPITVNVTTDPLEVARVTAMAAVAAADGEAGVVIFTDSTFAIASAKAGAMAEIVTACWGCSLLEVRDVPIAQCAERIPEITRTLLERYGKRWTLALAINDIYFDYMVPELTKSGIPNDRIRLLSAGDGSPAAFMRILARTYQIATAAEPLNLHGWQLVDELNRLLARQPASGYVVPVHLVTFDNAAFDGGTQFRYDPENDYREIYRHIWKP
ncbi:MAG: putative transporter, periplasmic protein [Proteobacteria bacterium]|nr:putative transporter, periplasmic protein [Pseudomonadota bacterium]